MNANAFCEGNKVFAMRVGEDLVLKLAHERVAELIETRVAMPHVVNGGPVKEWAACVQRLRRNGWAWQGNPWITFAKSADLSRRAAVG